MGTAQQLNAASVLAQNKQVTRASRRLYVGNLPVGIGLNERLLLDFFTSTLSAAGFLTPEPIIAVAMKPDQAFCFLEFRRVVDVPAGMALLSNVKVGVNVIKVAQPTDFAPPPPHLHDFQVPLSRLQPAPAVPTVTPAAPTIKMVTSAPSKGGGAVFQPLANLPRYPFHPKPPSHVLILPQLALQVDDDAGDVKSDVYWECIKYGGVKRVSIPQDQGQDTSGKMNCFVVFEHAKAAGCAFLALQKRQFNSHQITPHFFDPQAFKEAQFVLEKIMLA